MQVKYENEAVFELFTHFPFFVVGVYPRILFLSAIDTEIDQFSEKCPLELNLKKKLIVDKSNDLECSKMQNFILFCFYTVVQG